MGLETQRKLVAQTPKSVLSLVSKPVRHGFANVMPIWKSATQQVWKTALPGDQCGMEIKE